MSFISSDKSSLTGFGLGLKTIGLVNSLTSLQVAMERISKDENDLPKLPTGIAVNHSLKLLAPSGECICVIQSKEWPYSSILNSQHSGSPHVKALNLPEDLSCKNAKIA